MAVYLYNLQFSLDGSDYAVGRFTPYNGLIVNPTIATLSSAWFTYQLSGTPFNLGDYFSTVNSALNPSNWGSPQPDTNPLNLSPGDYVMMRVACLDQSAAGYRVRFTAILGRGTSQFLGAGANDLQTPFLMNTPSAQSSLPRAVVDIDGNQTSNWPPPIATDNSWVNWFGAAHAPADNAANDYSLNVGVSVYNNGTTYTFGKDPRLHVGGMVKRKHDDCAA